MSISGSEALSALSCATLTQALMAAPPQLPFVTMWNHEDDRETTTFAEFTSSAEKQAVYFRQHGVRPADRVVLIMPQGIPLMTAFAGAMLLGAVPAILAYPNHKAEPNKFREGLRGVSANLDARLVVVDEHFPSQLFRSITVSGNCKMVTSPSNFAGRAMRNFPRHSPQPLDIALIQHSAGTTGLQKGVALSHAVIMRQLDYLAQALRLTETDKIYSWLPLYHDMGLVACFLLPLVFHLPVVMQSPAAWVMQPGEMPRIISDCRCTLAFVPNFALQFLARRVSAQERAGCDLSSLRSLVNCSEPVRARSMDEFRVAYNGCGLREHALQSSYAMAENVFAVTLSDLDGGPRRIWVDGERFRSEGVITEVAEQSAGSVCLVSSGMCLPRTRVRIVSEDGKNLSAGHVGEILVSSDSLFDGYFNRPDLTVNAIRDGWWCSGDLGFQLDGELFVTGRKTDMIIVGGQNIYPQDIEEVAFAHPHIHDGRAVAFGIFNHELGTEDIAVVAEVTEPMLLNNAASMESELRALISGATGVAVRPIYLKPPRWIVKSTAGKPARAATRNKLTAEHPELTEPPYRANS